MKRINEVLDAEHPDLVVFTGDVIYAAPADKGMRSVLTCVSDRKIDVYKRQTGIGMVTG